MSTRFIGLDLAWSARNNSAVVALEAKNDEAEWIHHCERLSDDAEVLAFIQEVSGSGSALVAIDAPLIVPNEKGARPVDRQITHLFGRYHAGCYPANRSRPGGCTRGEGLVTSLINDGFVQDPYVRRQSVARIIFEVYPHPAMIALFHLEKTLRYKSRPNRSLALRRSELAVLRSYLIGLDRSVPAMSVSPAVANSDIDAQRGMALKRYEDLLDAAMCAYIAYYAWYWGPQGYKVYGDTTRGYILVPMTDWMRERLARHEG